MKNIVLVALVLSIVAGAVAYRTLTTNNPSRQLGMSSTQLPKDVKIFDVRTIEEYAASHVQTAVIFPITDMQTGKLPEIPKDTPVAVYCRSGHRASLALELLKKAGFTDVRSLGGLTDLAKYGLKAE